MTKGREIKPHIGIYGRRNSGKSSLINSFAAQEVSIVSEIAGTTTDTVKKTIEILDFGPVVMIDTAGIDDSGSLGQKRIEKTLQSIELIDLALIITTNNSFESYEEDLINIFNDYEIPFIIIHNKSDIEKASPDFIDKIAKKYPNIPFIEFSNVDTKNQNNLIELIKKTIPEVAWKTSSMLEGIINKGDIALLITPIDTEAPAGRMILPQVQTIRDVLDNDCVAIVLKENEVEHFLQKTQIKPRIAITDSQLFKRADAMIPKNTLLTGFSVLLAKHKGDFENYIKGTPQIANLMDGDRVLILESCSHHVSCDDIGRIKIPNWLTKFTGKKLYFDVVAGLDRLPHSITNYAIVIQCGGCMITRKQLINRLRPAIRAQIPVTNYGMAIAYTNGIYDRAIEPFVMKYK